MAPTLAEALTGLEHDVRRVRLAPAAEVRARGRRRTLRRRTAVTASALAVAGVAAAAVLPWSGADQDRPPLAAPVCAAPVDLEMPTSLTTIGVRVVDATGRAAGQEVVAELRKRDFTRAVAAGTTEPLPNSAVGVIRYGPLTVGDATVVRSTFSDHADMVFEPSRSDDLIDIVIGPAFQQLGTPTEVNQRLARIRPEDLPHAC